MKILNLTQHPATKEQINEGVFEPKNKDKVKELLTFNDLPTKEEIEERANHLVDIAIEEGAEAVMIGGAPYLMSTLEKYLKNNNIQPLYAFSKRVVEEIQKEDGTVEKRVTFKHEGFVEI